MYVFKKQSKFHISRGLTLFFDKSALARSFCSWSWCEEGVFPVGTIINSSAKNSLLRLPDIFMTPKKPKTTPPIAAHFIVEIGFFCKQQNNYRNIILHTTQDEFTYHLRGTLNNIFPFKSRKWHLVWMQR